MEAICKSLDETTVEFFDVLAEVYIHQDRLECQMKDGFLQLSRARYNMGNKSVGSLQWNEREMESMYEVTFSEEEGDQRHEPFTLNAKTIAKPDGDKDGLRQRKTQNTVRQFVGKAKSLNEIEDIAADLSDMELEKVIDATLNPQNRRRQLTMSMDPLKWFGVLVPQSLRSSQGNFKDAVKESVILANLRYQLLDIKDKYANLLKQKKNIEPASNVDTE